MDDLEKQLMDLSGMEPEQAVTPTEQPAPSVVHETVGYGALEQSRLQQVRTFNSDLAQAVKEKGGSVVRIAIAEDERHRREMEEQSIKSKKNIAFIIGGVLLVCASIGAVIYGYQHKKAAEVVQIPAAPALPSSIIASDDVAVINISDMQLADIYAHIAAFVVNPGIEPGLVENVILAEGVGAGATRPPVDALLARMRSHAPDVLVRALSKDYMLGIYRYDRGNLFFVVHGTAHDFLLSGMLAWEPFLFEDMAPLFSIDTSVFTPAQLAGIKFQDAIIGNRDARAVFGPDKKPIFYYSFIDQNTILFAADPKTLTEVVRRF